MREVVQVSNEELVAKIQAGSVDLTGQLWEQVEGLVKWKAKRIMTALEGRNSRGVEFDDLYQSGYLALVAAIETYIPAAGSFAGWFMYYLKTVFYETTGIRTQMQQKDPLNSALSLEKPIADDEDSSLLLEIIPDPAGELCVQNVEDRIFYQQMHEALELALNRLPEDQKGVLKKRYYEGLTSAQTADVFDTTPEAVRRIELHGLRKLRTPSNAGLLRPFYDFDYYGLAGLGAFRSTGMSIQERYLILMEKDQP